MSSFADDADTLCDFSIVDHNSDTENTTDTHAHLAPKYPSIHSQRKHAYRNTFGDSHIQYHDFDNQDSLTFKDKYMTLLRQELQNQYWNLHDPITTKGYQISKDMDIEMMPHAMYFTGNLDTITKINHVPYQTIEYTDNGMFTAKLMNDTPIEIFIDNGATPSILPLHSFHKYPILHTYPKTESNTPIHTGGGLITSHFRLEIPLKLQHQTIQIKALVCDSECPYNLILGQTSMAQLSTWKDYASHKLYLQQISIPLTVRNNICILPGKTGVVSLTLQPNKTSFTPRHTIIGKDIAYVKPLDPNLPLRPIEIEFENNRCCIEIHNTSGPPVSSRPYTLALKHHRWVQEEIETLERVGIITKSMSPWASPIIIVPKKSQPGEPPKKRLCIDFRKINDLQQKVIAEGKSKGCLSLIPL